MRQIETSYDRVTAAGLLMLALLALTAAPGAAQTPPEVQGISLERSGDGEILSFPFVPDVPGKPTQHYNVYRGRLGAGFDADFSSMGRLRQVIDPRDGAGDGYTAINDTDDLGLEENYYYLVTAANVDGEGTLGNGSGSPRGGVFGDPPLGAPELYPQTWNCVPYTGEPAPPFLPPVPGNVELPTFTFPELCPEGTVPEPKEYDAPKGSPPVEEGMSSEAESSRGPGGYWYSWTQATPVPGFDDGAFGRMTVESPVIDRLNQTHSLAEIASRSGFNYMDYVEVGWTVDRIVNNGSVSPHLFVFRWVNGVPGVYNGAGWVQFSRSIVPGQKLPVGWLMVGGYVNFGGNWWCFVFAPSADAVGGGGGGGLQPYWIGYYPGTLWGGGFTNLTQVQWFGEVWANGTPPNNEMGNGIRGTTTPVPKRPAYIDILSTVDSLTISAQFYPFPAAFNTNNSYYDMTVFNTPNGFFYYGGPGR